MKYSTLVNKLGVRSIKTTKNNVTITNNNNKRHNIERIY